MKVVLGVYTKRRIAFNNVEMGYQLEWFSDPYKYEEIIELMHEAEQHGAGSDGVCQRTDE